MKTFIYFGLVLIALVVLTESAHIQDQSTQRCSQSSEEAWQCSQGCYDQGLHGQCDPDGVCRCYECIYKACKNYCRRQNRIGRCDEAVCECL